MYFILIPFVAAGLAAKIKNNKYKNKLISPILELDNITRHGILNRGNIQNVFHKRQSSEEKGFIKQD